MASMGRPAQPAQKSRKGKKSWRKNIDLDDIEQDLEANREKEIVLGPAPLFEIDVKGSSNDLSREMREEKKLKSDEILNKRSAVPVIPSIHQKKQEKPRKKVDKELLKKIAGFESPAAKLQAQIARDGLVKSTGPKDLWGDEEEAPVVTKRPAPPQPPLPDAEAVEVPDGGRSYNPELSEWKASLAEEQKRYSKEENARIKREAEQTRIEELMAQPSPEASETEESDIETEESELGRLSVNPPASEKRKTRAQINKQRRHLQRLELQRRLKEKSRSLYQPTPASQPSASEAPRPKGPRKLNKAHSGHPVINQPLAIKLSDELDDSLRRVRGEGNLFKERLRSLQARGLVEARMPQKRRRSRRKQTEKWGFKDIKL